MVSLYGSSPQVKCLVQTGLDAVSSFTVTHSWPGQMAPTEVAITAEQVLDVCVL